jgi:hypothetical protein
VSRRRGGHPAKAQPKRSGNPFLSKLSRVELEAVVFDQDAMIGQRNVILEDVRRELPEERSIEVDDLILEPMPLDVLYERMHRDPARVP